MKLADLKKRVTLELSRRDLKTPRRRLRELVNVCDYIKQYSPIYIDTEDNVILPENKEKFKVVYRKFKNKVSLSGAENSVINELYNQYLK